MAVEWPTATVRDVTIRITKGTTPTTIGGQFVERGINFVKVESITNSGHIEQDKLAHIDERSHALLSRSVLEQDDILFTIAGTIGRIALVPASVLPANTNQAVAIVRPDQGKVLPRFLYYVLGDESRVRQAHTRVVQSVQANFSLAELRLLEIPLPDLTEQRAIAHVLGTLDDKIELNRRTNETLNAMARALFKSWFVDFDPVRAKAEGRDSGLPKPLADLFPDSFEDSDLGEIPKGWTVKALSEITTVITKGTTPSQSDTATDDETDAGINYVRVNAIDEESAVLFDKLTKIPESVHLGVLKRSVLQEGDVLYTIAGTIGRSAIVDESLLPANTNQAVAIVRAKQAIPAAFLAMTMRAAAFREDLHSNIVHAVQANLSLGMLSSARAVVPPKETLRQMFMPIAELAKRVGATRAESRTLAALRDTLLPKLISGELRVKDAKRFMEKATE